MILQAFIGRLTTIRETQTKLYDEIKKECSKYGDDVKYLAGPVTNSFLFRRLFTIKDQCKQVCVSCF